MLQTQSRRPNFCFDRLVTIGHRCQEPFSLPALCDVMCSNRDCLMGEWNQRVLPLTWWSCPYRGEGRGPHRLLGGWVPWHGTALTGPPCPAGECTGVRRCPRPAGRDGPRHAASAAAALLKVTPTEMSSWHAELWGNCEPHYGATQETDIVRPSASHDFKLCVI